MFFLIKCSGCYYFRPPRNMFNVQSSNLGDIGINVNLDHKQCTSIFIFDDRQRGGVS